MKLAELMVCCFSGMLCKPTDSKMEPRSQSAELSSQETLQQFVLHEGEEEDTGSDEMLPQETPQQRKLREEIRKIPLSDPQRMQKIQNLMAKFHGNKKTIRPHHDRCQECYGSIFFRDSSMRHCYECNQCHPREQGHHCEACGTCRPHGHKHFSQPVDVQSGRPTCAFCSKQLVARNLALEIHELPCKHLTHGLCLHEYREKLGFSDGQPIESLPFVEAPLWRCPICRKTWVEPPARNEFYRRRARQLLAQLQDADKEFFNDFKVVEISCNDCGKSTKMLDLSEAFQFNVCPCGSFSTDIESLNEEQQVDFLDISAIVALLKNITQTQDLGDSKETNEIDAPIFLISILFLLPLDLLAADFLALEYHKSAAPLQPHKRPSMMMTTRGMQQYEAKLPGILSALAELKPESTVLEGGTGDARLIFELAIKYARKTAGEMLPFSYIGIDEAHINNVKLKQLLKKRDNRITLHEEITLEQFVIDNPDLHGTIDLYIDLYGALSYSEDLGQTLQAIFLLLKKGGIAFIYTSDCNVKNNALSPSYSYTNILFSETCLSIKSFLRSHANGVDVKSLHDGHEKSLFLVKTKDDVTFPELRLVNYFPFIPPKRIYAF